MKRQSPTVGMLVSVILLTACGGGDRSFTGRDITVTGSVLILDSSNFRQSGSSCSGTGDFATVRRGGSVTVDGDATATLGDGSITEEGNCRFLFEVDIPERDDRQGYDFQVEGMPSVVGFVNTAAPIYWQSSDADGWVTLGWDS